MAFLSEYKEFPVGPPIAGCSGDPNSSGYVYVIGFDEAEIVKIGSAISIGMRLTQLQGGCPFELKLLAAVSIYEAQPLLVEFAAHSIAREMGAHIRGEWFELSVNDALRCIIDAAKRKRVSYGPYIAAHKAAANAGKAEREIERLDKLRVKLGMA